tara:strand:- start:120 stop:2657 length:2538 start_codon:yes stop_codon:yes gene_type:complete
MADYDIIIKAQDKTGNTLNKVDKNLKKIEKSSGGVTKALGLAGGALAAIGAGQILKGIVDQYRAFEKYRTVLAVYTGSQAAANKELDRLKILAKSLPQDLSDLTEGFVLFKSRGIDTSSKALTAFSNIATANGKSMTQLGEAVADALTGEFERMKEFGIKVAKENDKFVADIGNGQSIIANSSQDLVNKLQALGEVGGKFGKAAEENNKTLNQSFSNLSGSIFSTSVVIGEKLRPEMKKAVDQLSEWIDKNDELAAKIGVGLGDAVGAVASGITILANNIDLIRQAAIAYLGVRFAGAFVNLAVRMSSAVKATQTLGGMFGTMGAIVRTVVSGPLLKLATMLGKGGIIGIAITAVLFLFDKFKLDMFTIGESSTNMARLVNGAWQLIVQGATTAVEYLSGLWNTFSEGFSNIFLNSENMFGKTMSAIADIAKKYINFVIGNWVAFGKTVYAIITNFPKWFMDSMKGMLKIADDFGNAVVEKFTNIGTALEQAMAGDFAKAWDTIGKESAFSFEKSWNSAFKNSTGLLDGVDFEEIYGTDYLTGGIDYVKAKAEDVVKILNNASIMPRMGTGSPTAGAPIPAPAGASPITEGLLKEVAVTDKLKKQYMDLGSLRSQGVAGVEAARTLENTIQAYREYGYARQDADELASKAAEKYNQKLIAQYTLYGESRKEAEEMAYTVNDAFADMSEGMAASMSKSIMAGKGLFDSFGSYLESWADKVLTQILEQMLLQPMINQMGSWLGGMGGGSTGGFDLMSIFSGFFANGGYIPSGQVGIAGEAGAELITGPANVTPLNGEMNSGGGQNVTININAIDTQSGTQFLIDHKREVEGIIHNAYSRRGKQGIYN